LRVYHFRRQVGTKNFGDDLSPGFVSAVLDEDVEYAVPIAAQLMGAGSILDYWSNRQRKFRRTLSDMIRRAHPLAIWGSGLILETRLFLPNLDVLAVRGPLTAKCMGLTGDYTYGDPGLLASEIRPAASKTGRIGIVPHYLDKSHEALEPFRDDSRFTMIDVETPWEDVLSAISSCDMILSSSLHGLIVADSYGIPNIRLRFTDRIVGGDFKFLDYGYSVARTDLVARQILTPDDISLAVAELEASGDVAANDIVQKRQDELIQSLRQWRQRR